MAAYFMCGCGSLEFCRNEHIVVRINTGRNGWRDEEQPLSVEIEYQCVECGQDHTDEIARKRREPGEGSAALTKPASDSQASGNFAESPARSTE